MSGYRRCGAFTTALLGFLIVMLDTTVINVALARIDGDLGAPVASLQQVIDVYTPTFVTLQLSAEAVCDRLGARGVHLLGLVVLGLLSAACTLAPASGAPIVFHALQGVGAAAIVPVPLAIFSLIRDRPVNRARATGSQGGAGGVTVAVGPVARGLPVASTGRRFVFWVNLSLVAATLWLVARRLPAPEMRLPRRREGGDLSGQVLSVAGLAATIHGVIAAGGHGWGLPVVASTLAGLSLLMVFALVERTVGRPMLPTAVFSRPRFTAVATVGSALDTGFFGRLFVLALLLQRYLDYKSWFAGLALTPQACSVVIASPVGGRMTVRIGTFLTMLTGLLIGTVEFAGLAVVTALMPYLLVVALTFLGGFGTVPTMPAAASAVVASVSAGYTGVAGSAINATRQTGSVVGVAVLGNLIASSDFLTGFHRAIVGALAVFAVATILAAAVALKAASRPERVDAP